MNLHNKDDITNSCSVTDLFIIKTIDSLKNIDTHIDTNIDTNIDNNIDTNINTDMDSDSILSDELSNILYMVTLMNIINNYE